MRVAALPLVLLLPAVAVAQTATPAVGIPSSVAERRAAIISNVRYSLTVSIPENVAERVTGRNVIHF
ncbi:MAG TPA: hypothetical protein VEK56_08670, partial [Vicinamibacterales bacterium]|nr:hypothetical protein [Vicinamibacterales bacterium]